jgi:hypothetical protein
MGASPNMTSLFSLSPTSVLPPTPAALLLLSEATTSPPHASAHPARGLGTHPHLDYAALTSQCLARLQTSCALIGQTVLQELPEWWPAVSPKRLSHLCLTFKNLVGQDPRASVQEMIEDPKCSAVAAQLRSDLRLAQALLDECLVLARLLVQQGVGGGGLCGPEGELPLALDFLNSFSIRSAAASGGGAPATADASAAAPSSGAASCYPALSTPSLAFLQVCHVQHAMALALDALGKEVVPKVTHAKLRLDLTVEQRKGLGMARKKAGWREVAEPLRGALGRYLMLHGSDASLAATGALDDVLLDVSHYQDGEVFWYPAQQKSPEDLEGGVWPQLGTVCEEEHRCSVCRSSAMAPCGKRHLLPHLGCAFALWEELGLFL